jgi:formiminoglutamase
MTAGAPRTDARWPSAADWIAAGTGGRAADLALLGVPTHATSLSPTGAYKTPAAVRQALHRLSTWSPARRIDLSTLAALDLGNVDDPDLGEEGEWRVTIAAESGASLARLLVVVGGDNSLTCPVGRGALDTLSLAGLVTVDAHLDIREGRSNGSPVRRLLDAGLPGERIVQVGIADWANSRSYSDEAYARGLHAIFRDDVAARGMADCMEQAIETAAGGRGGVLVDLDLDVCDRSVAPGCPASLPGGLSAREILTAAFLAGADPRVRAVDITEVDATADPDGRTVRLAAMCILEIAAGLTTRPRDLD